MVSKFLRIERCAGHVEIAVHPAVFDVHQPERFAGAAGAAASNDDDWAAAKERRDIEFDLIDEALVKRAAKKAHPTLEKN